MARFQVYSASAGAGKTYSLVFSFLKICLQDDNPRKFMRILAITFTNKAAKEMKSRIVEQLRVLADFNKTGKEPAMMTKLCESLDISREKLSYRAEKSLKTILHQYSAFSVSTIDRFTNRLIRSFARDLEINANYEVELDNAAMLSEAIDQMMAELEENTLTARFLLQFVNESLEEGRSPRPEIKLLEMGFNLFREDAFLHIKNLRSLSQEDILKAKNELFKEKASIDNSVQTHAQELFDFICDCGLEREHFSRGTVYNYVQNLSEGEPSKWIPGKTVIDAVGGADFYAKGKAKICQPLFAPYEDEIRQKLQTLVSYIQDKYPRYHLCNLVLKDLNTLAVLTEMDYHLQQVKETTNRLPIGEFNKLISAKLEGEPADYLFEKLGEKYHHFFIDEFQDTSLLQWKNILPLINNAMASGGSAMIVGDGKQSIYRWRGGDVSQFIGLSNDTDPSNKVMINEELVELYPREKTELPANYRSRKNIVEFNNEFFRESASLLLGEEHRDLYSTGNNQKVIKADGGHVEIKLLDYSSSEKDIYAEAQCAEVLEIIQDARARGLSLKDIAILVRNNADGALLAEYLLNNKISIISPDSLLLNASKEVRALVSFLRFLARPDDYQGRYDFLLLASQLPEIQENYSEKHIFISELIRQESDDLHRALQKLLTGYDADRLHLLSLPDKAYYIADAMHLELHTDPFLHALMDYIQDFHQNKGEDIAAFIRWWDHQGNSRKLAMPENVDAVQIMTIHKSKGLQFNLTILAFADWMATREPGQSRAWLSLPEGDMYGLPSAWVGLSDPRENPVDEQYRQVYESNKASVYLDNLNLLYVAFTRAVDELYVLSGSGLHNANSTIYRYIQHYFSLKDVERHYSVGEKNQHKIQKKNDAGETPLRTYKRTAWQQKLKVAPSAPVYWQGGELSEEISYGKKIHGLLADLKTADELKTLLEKHLTSGFISSDEFETLQQLLKNVVNHKDLNVYYTHPVSVFNEQEILIPGATSARPDRVMIAAGKAHIIDYKTGLPNSRHHAQLNEYRHLLSEMGFPQGDNVLVYIGSSLNVEKWQS